MWTDILTAITNWSEKGYPITDEEGDIILDEAGNNVLSEGEPITLWENILNE